MTLTSSSNTMFEKRQRITLAVDIRFYIITPHLDFISLECGTVRYDTIRGDRW